MSTTSYNPNEGNAPAARGPQEGCLKSSKPESGNSLGSQPVRLSNFYGGRHGWGHSEASDDDLTAGAQCGDQQAFVELCRRHSSLVKSKILRIVRNQEDAEDVLQDTLLRAYTHMPTFRRSCKFSTWLTTIGVNSALMIMRKRKVRKETGTMMRSLDSGTLDLHEPVDRSPGPEGTYLKQQAILLVRREVEKLCPSLRSVVNHYYGSDCSLEEAAKALDISLSATKSRLLRGRVRLRSSLAKYRVPKSPN